MELCLQQSVVRKIQARQKSLCGSACSQLIRRASEHDGVFDFDPIVRDPSQPARLLLEYDSGDHLHPNDQGCQALANAMDLSMFGVEPK